MNIQVPAELDWKHSKVSCGLSLFEGVLGIGSSAFYHPSPILRVHCSLGNKHGPFQQVWVSRSEAVAGPQTSNRPTVQYRRIVKCSSFSCAIIWHRKTATRGVSLHCWRCFLFYWNSFFIVLLVGEVWILKLSLPLPWIGLSVELAQVSYILPGIEFSAVDVFVVKKTSKEQAAWYENMRFRTAKGAAASPKRNSHGNSPKPSLFTETNKNLPLQI